MLKVGLVVSFNPRDPILGGKKREPCGDPLTRWQHRARVDQGLFSQAMVKVATHMSDPHGGPQTSPQHTNLHGFLVWLGLRKASIPCESACCGLVCRLPCGSPGPCHAIRFFTITIGDRNSPLHRKPKTDTIRFFTITIAIATSSDQSAALSS